MKMTKLCQRALSSRSCFCRIHSLRPSAAEATRFLASYGGTAGYQLPLWVNKELGFSKKYGVDLEIILIQAGSPNIQALLGGSCS
jgi:ABC-type nitrate/sulfonate/bicarbonate transport system substrate-binding protein